MSEQLENGEQSKGLAGIFGELLKPKKETRGRPKLDYSPPVFERDSQGLAVIRGAKCRFVGAVPKWANKAKWEHPDNLLGSWEPLEGKDPKSGIPYANYCAICPIQYDWVRKTKKPGFLVKTHDELQLWEVVSPA